MDPKLRRIIKKIENESLRSKVFELVENPTIEIGGKVYKDFSLERSPASLTHHHNYPGGLLEHIVSTVKIALTLCDCVEEVYHGKVDRDLIIGGVILHDFYKPLTYEMKENGTYGITTLAERVDHLSLIVSEMMRRGFPIDLIHIVCAHHGEAGPLMPRTVEALICHLADLVDSRLNGEVIRAARYLIKEAIGDFPGKITSKQAFEIVHSKAVGGWETLRKTVNKLLEEL